MAVSYESLSLPYKFKHRLYSFRILYITTSTDLILVHESNHIDYVDYNVPISSDEQMDIMI
jgi:hypothetical protein